MTVSISEEAVEALAIELARQVLAESLPDRVEVPMALIEPILASYRQVCRRALLAAASLRMGRFRR